MAKENKSPKLITKRKIDERILIYSWIIKDLIITLLQNCGKFRLSLLDLEIYLQIA